MLPKKIILNDRIRKFIIDSRKSAKEQNSLMTADYISKKIGRAISWLSQVENGRLKSVKTNDLINVFCIIEGKDKDDPKQRKHVTDYLDDKIMYIDITEKHGIFDKDGNVLDFSEMLSFQSARGHIKFAGKNLITIFYGLLDTPIEEIQNSLNKKIKHMYHSVIDWFNRAFNDTAELFSDEVSTINLYLLVETSITLYNGHYEYFGLNPLNITDIEKAKLKEKLNTNYFLKEKTIIKPIDEYTDFEFDEVVTHFSTEEFMMWKNKHTYIGDDPFPMVINYKASILDKDNFISYEDVNTVTGLNENEYLYLIKQIYTQVDFLYKKYKTLLVNYNDCQEELDELYAKNEDLQRQLKDRGTASQ